MIQENTLPQLPDIFKEDAEKKKKKKASRYYVHKQTTNLSFLKMYRNLALLNIQNNDFFLALYDTTLIGVDPYDENLSIDMQARILMECKRNFWYFIREVVRIPVSGADLGGGKKYHLHRGNLAISWCFLNHINFFVELPRQNFKSISIDIILLWLYNFGTTNSSMLIMNKEHKDAKENLARIKEMRDVLPEYLRFNTRFNSEGKELKLPENKEDSFNPKTRNTLVTKPSATSKDKADLLGRGMTQPVQWFDEIAFLKYNMIIYDSASPAAGQAAQEAKANGKPYCKMMSTTPGDMNTEYGKDAYEFKKNCAIFREDFYDWKIKDVEELVRINSTNGFFNIVFNYRQLGRDSEYFDKCVTDLRGNWLKVRREVLLQWITITSDSPFDKKDIEELQELKLDRDNLVDLIYIDKYHTVELYDKIPANTPIILSCDVASGAMRDASTIAIINAKTKRCIGEFRNNKVDTTHFAFIIHTLATEVCPNCMIVIERNNVGSSVISTLLKTDVKSKLYFEDNTTELEMKIKKGRDVVNDTTVRKYGVWTDATKREQMYELLMKFVELYKDRITTPLLVDEISQLIYNKKGQIDHPAEGHDDMVMGYLIGMWVYYYGKNLGKFGILRMPDVDPATGKTAEEIEAEEEYKRELKERNAAKQFNRLNADVTDTPDILASTPEFKTIDDYYREIDKEREIAYQMEKGGKVHIADALNFDSSRDVSTFGSMVFGEGYQDDPFGSQIVSSLIGDDL